MRLLPGSESIIDVALASGDGSARLALIIAIRKHTVRVKASTVFEVKDTPVLVLSSSISHLYTYGVLVIIEAGITAWRGTEAERMRRVAAATLDDHDIPCALREAIREANMMILRSWWTKEARVAIPPTACTEQAGPGPLACRHVTPRGRKMSDLGLTQSAGARSVWLESQC